jgi:uroporphyrinogen-III synthase
VRRVGITSASERADRVAAPFEVAGFAPVSVPCVRTRPSDRPVIEEMRRLVDTADLVVLTSVTAFELLWPQGAPSVPVAAVGRATAAAVRRRGGTVSTVGRSTGRALAETLDVAGKRVAFPHARGTDQETLDLIAAGAAALDAMPVYENLPVAPPADLVDAVVFGSPSAVRGWALSRSFSGVVVAAIGPVTAAAVEQEGGRVDVVADIPSYQRLAHSLAEEMLT